MKIPPRLQTVLVRAVAAEKAARGSERRTAFQTTRHLLAGAQAIGVPSADLARILGVGVDSIRTRSGVDGSVPFATFARLAELDADGLERWRRRGYTFENADHASALIRTFLTDAEEQLREE